MHSPGLINRKAIVYNVIHINNGFQIQAVLPKRLPPGDRIKIIDWFHSYRTQIQHQHPMWVTMFHSSDHAYSLDVIPAETPKQLVAQSISPIGVWKQLSFDYA